MTTAQIAALADLRTSTSDLLLGLEAERWTDADVRAPSVLPGWSRGHVLTHIARNADGIAQALSGALRGEIVPRYPLGPTGRNADIEAGSGRGVMELIADVRDSADRLDRVFGALADADGWNLPTEDRPAGDYAIARWREVEVHRVDLAGSYGPADWPAGFVSYLVPTVVERIEGVALRVEVSADGSVSTDLPGRVFELGEGERIEVIGPDWAIGAWAIGRAGADSPAAQALSSTPELPSWL
jgi:maleylpyruvate isomerase